MDNRNLNKKFLDDLNLAFKSTIDLVKEAIDCKFSDDQNASFCNNIINVNMFVMYEIGNKLKSLQNHNKYIIFRMKGNDETNSSN